MCTSLWRWEPLLSALIRSSSSLGAAIFIDRGRSRIRYFSLSNGGRGFDSSTRFFSLFGGSAFMMAPSWRRRLLSRRTWKLSPRLRENSLTMMRRFSSMLAWNQKLQTITFGCPSNAFSQLLRETVCTLRLSPSDVVGVYCALPFIVTSEMQSSTRLGNSLVPTVTIVLMTCRSRRRRKGTR